MYNNRNNFISRNRRVQSASHSRAVEARSDDLSRDHRAEHSPGRPTEQENHYYQRNPGQDARTSENLSRDFTSPDSGISVQQSRSQDFSSLAGNQPTLSSVQDMYNMRNDIT